MREQFEKLPEIKKRLISVKFNEVLNHYESKNPVLIECLEVALFLNGAWYAYQGQQEEIERLRYRISTQTNRSHELLKECEGLQEEVAGLREEIAGYPIPYDELSKVFDDVATVGNADVSEILHSIDNYFDQADSSKTQRQADNLIAEIYEKLSGEVSIDHRD